MPHHAELRPDSDIEWTKQLLQQPPGPWPDGWEGYPSVVRAFQELYDAAANNPPPPPEFPIERGIVICSGGWRFFPSLYVTVRAIRHVGCELPIQVWYQGDLNEFDVRMEAALRPYGVGWICANSFLRENNMARRCLGGWELKPLAAAYCPFKEVISLDADSYPAYNPEEFMEHAEYQRVGAAFWPDQHPLEAGQWERFGVPVHDEPAWESGQFIVDKSRHWRPLWLTVWMNDYSDYVYKHIYGDKDTFHLSWRKCGHEVCVPCRHPAWHHVAFLQLDFDGRVLFVHRTRDKFRWSDGEIDGQPVQNWYMTGQWHGATQFIQGMPLEAEGHRWLKESDQLIRPERYFHFPDGATGHFRATWDSVALYDEYRLPNRFEPQDVVLDCGASIGDFAWAVIRRGAGQVVCVEPVPEFVRAIRQNVEGPVHVVEAAVWDKEEPVIVRASSSEDMLSPASVFATGEECGRVDGVPLDKLIEHTAAMSDTGRVRLLKLDVEGAEYRILDAATKLDYVDEIVGEAHAGIQWRGREATIDDLVRILENAGFDVEVQKNGELLYLFFARRVLNTDLRTCSEEACYA